VRANLEDGLVETMLHEIAHAIAGEDDRGHGRVWQAACRRIGGTPNTYMHGLVQPR